MEPEQEQHAQYAPEVANADYPETVPPGQYRQYSQYQQYPQSGPIKPDDASQGGYGAGGVPHSAYNGNSNGNGNGNGSQHDPASPHPHHAVGALPGGEKRRGTICGCTALVFALCTIIALLSAAVVGLAAGTGVEASRASAAQNKVAQLNAKLASTTASGTSSSPTSTSTSFASLDDNCSGNPDGVSGTTYDAFSLFGNYTFTIQCNADALGSPLLSLFAADIKTCMDSCASYSKYVSTSFSDNSTNSTCGGVSFIPLWTTKTEALKGGAPGNCYLKPTQTGQPSTPNIGTECHAGILNSS